MPTNENGGSDDFVFIDDPMQIAGFNYDFSGTEAYNFPAETDYVTVDSDGPSISASHDTPVEPTPDDDRKAVIEIEYFEPMLLSAFPEELTQDALVAPIASRSQTLKGEVSRSSNPVHPHSLFVSNAILLLECFFHFEALHPKIGRGPVLYTVAKACELSPGRARTLQHHVACTIDTLRGSRMAFLRRTKSLFVWRAEDPNVRELARLVDRYIDLQSEEPREVEEKWYNGPAFENLWFKWQDFLESEGLKTTEGGMETAVDRNRASSGGGPNSLVSEAVRAVDRLDNVMIDLDVSGGLRSGGLTRSERLLLQRALDRATRWTARNRDLIRSHLQQDVSEDFITGTMEVNFSQETYGTMNGHA
ncbi:hypothetical protein LA080_003093 [Diaporthe eres]|uniref:Uncharacterized protein n=1 Tax=Diaporthe vaccinii TaxID=105482 RepID=A0ABR4DUK6_9PEZI|nr:hypothetical protein LA080_003093 [Diaporthe eres]